MPVLVLAAIVVIYTLAPTLFWVLVLLLVIGMIFAAIEETVNWIGRRLRSLFTR